MVHEYRLRYVRAKLHPIGMQYSRGLSCFAHLSLNASLMPHSSQHPPSSKFKQASRGPTTACVWRGIPSFMTVLVSVLLEETWSSSACPRRLPFSSTGRFCFEAAGLYKLRSLRAIQRHLACHPMSSQIIRIRCRQRLSSDEYYAELVLIPGAGSGFP